jgi:hypothetical protein
MVHRDRVSEFRVHAEAVADHAARLSTVAPDLDEVRGGIGSGRAAAAATPAADALEGLTAHLNARLAEFGAAAEHLRRTMLAAGAEYARADATVQESAPPA